MCDPRLQTRLQPSQIVSLTWGDRRLYGEVIDVVMSRQRAWVRPLLLVIQISSLQTHSSGSFVANFASDGSASDDFSGDGSASDGSLGDDFVGDRFGNNGIGYGIYSLQGDSHLLWPMRLFEVALDQEVLPILPYLSNESRTDIDVTPQAAQAFRQFISQVWRANPQFFC